jgi:integrase
MAKQYKYRKTFTFDGKRYFVRGKTEKELAENVEKKKDDLRKGVITSDTLVSDWIDVYLKTYKEPHVSDRNYKDIQGYFENYIKPIIGGMSIRSVKPVHCQQVLNGMIGKSGGYIKKIHYTMKSMFEAAIDNGIAVKNPAKNIRRPDGKDGSHRAITEHERKIFLQACEISDYGLWGLYMLYTGAGPGETAQLIGKHIDLKERKIFIDGTKNGNRKRYVPMDAELYRRFSKLKINPFKPVFVNGDGKKLTRANLKRRWEAITKEMNILMGCKTDMGKLRRLVKPCPLAEDFTAYCLRHTYATDLRDAGVDISTAMYYLGHSTTRMLTQVYIHHTDRAFEDSRSKINAFRRKLKRVKSVSR